MNQNFPMGQTKMKGLRSGQPLNMQSFIYYRLRCIFAGDLAKAFAKFGGIAAQFNLLGIVLRLAITVSPFVAMEYDRLIRPRVSALARERYHDASTVDYAATLSHEQPEIARAIVASTIGFQDQRPKQPPPINRAPTNAPEAGFPVTPGNSIPAISNDQVITGEAVRPKTFGPGTGNRWRNKKKN